MSEKTTAKKEEKAKKEPSKEDKKKARQAKAKKENSDGKRKARNKLERKKIERKTKAESKKLDRDKERVLKKLEGAKDPSGKRSLVLATEKDRTDFVQIGDKKYPVKRHKKRRSSEWLLGVDIVSVKEKDWLDGKAHLGLTEDRAKV